MNNYEKRLLSHLQEDNSKDKNDPLGNVKNAMGEIAFVSGNPLTKTEITLQISIRYFDDFTSAPLLPGALPLALQTKLPVFLFGLTDYYGGYTKCRTFSQISNNNLIPNQWSLQGTSTRAGVNQLGVSIFGLNGNDAIIQQFGVFIAGTYVPGDLIFLFFGNGGVSGVWSIMIVHCNNVAYGTFLNSFVSDLITINTIRYIVPIANINQFVHPLRFGYQTLFGKTDFDSIDPRMYITSTDFQQQIADIPIKLPIDKAVMLLTDIDTACQNISMVLFVEKVEPLTHKNNLSKR